MSRRDKARSNSKSTSQPNLDRFILAEKVKGRSLQSIAEELNLPISLAASGLLRSLDESAEDLDSDYARKLELIRLEHLINYLDRGICSGDVEAIRAANTIAARRAKLMGLDRSVRDQVDAAVTRYVERILRAAEGCLDPQSYKRLRLEILKQAPTSTRSQQKTG